MEDHLMEIRVIEIDVGKSILHLVGLDKYGKVASQKQLSQHFLGAAPTAPVHDVRLMRHSL